MRRFMTWHKAQVITWIVAVLVMGALVQAVRNEATTRTDQFCGLVLSVHNDRVTRLRHTQEYLKTPAGEEPTSLNEYIIHISLPQNEHEVKKEREHIPSICKQDKKEKS